METKILNLCDAIIRKTEGQLPIDFQPHVEDFREFFDASGLEPLYRGVEMYLLLNAEKVPNYIYANGSSLTFRWNNVSLHVHPLDEFEPEPRYSVQVYPEASPLTCSITEHDSPAEAINIVRSALLND